MYSQRGVLSTEVRCVVESAWYEPAKHLSSTVWFRRMSNQRALRTKRRSSFRVSDTRGRESLCLQSWMYGRDCQTRPASSAALGVAWAPAASDVRTGRSYLYIRVAPTQERVSVLMRAGGIPATWVSAVTRAISLILSTRACPALPHSDDDDDDSNAARRRLISSSQNLSSSLVAQCSARTQLTQTTTCAVCRQR